MTDIPPMQTSSQTVQPRRSGVLGIVAIVLAILALAASVPIYVGLKIGPAAISLAAGGLLAVAALVLGIVAVVKSTSKKGMGAAGLVLSLVAGIAVFGGLFLALHRARDLAQGAVCASNVNEIGWYYIMYQTESDDASPPSLEALMDHYAAHGDPECRRLLTCPAARGRHPQPHYFYLAPKGPARGKTLILCDLKGNHPRGERAVLTYGASVERFRTEAEFQAALARPENAAFAAALKEADRP